MLTPEQKLTRLKLKILKIKIKDTIYEDKTNKNILYTICFIREIKNFRNFL